MFALLATRKALALPEVMEVLHDARPGKREADIVAVQGIYNWAPLGEEHIAPIEGIFGLNR